MSTNPTITTIIPTFRRPHLLKKAIQSVIDQTYPHFIVWVCDNNSEDETSEVVEEFAKKDSRIRYFRHPKNIGMLGNYQHGLSLIETDFFSFLSDDDFLLPNFYSTALKQFQNHPEAGFVAGSTVIMTPKFRIVCIPLSHWKREGIFMPPDGVLEMIGKYPVPTSVLFPKRILPHVSIDNENALYWDCDYLLQIAANYPIVVTQELCAVFLHHPNSYSNHQDLQKLEKGFSRLTSRLQNFVPFSVYEKGKNLLDLNLLESKAGLYISFLFAKKFFEAKTLLTELKNHPHLGKKAIIYQLLYPLSFTLPVFVNFLKVIKELKNIIKIWKLRKTDKAILKALSHIDDSS